MDSGIPAHRLARPMVPARDRAVVELVGRFRQLTAGQIGAVLFAGNGSQTPLDRCLKRLVERRYLARLSRLVGGDGGGSAQYVYQLGRAGCQLVSRPGRYWPLRAVNLHTLAIADCFVRLVEAERAGTCTILRFDPEPDVPANGVTLTPDALVDLGYHERGMKTSHFLEVDRATEHRETIKDKCVRYWRAYQQWDGDVFPYVIFVVPDRERATVIRQVIASGPTEAQPLFQVFLASTFSDVGTLVQ
jgi:hypothetical protein